jgi:hypothetical protein
VITAIGFPPEQIFAVVLRQGQIDRATKFNFVAHQLQLNHRLFYTTKSATQKVGTFDFLTRSSKICTINLSLFTYSSA